MKTIIATAALLTLLPAHAVVITQWDFNASNLTPSTGSGTAALAGGTTTSGFNTGGGSSDPVQPGIGWSITTFPAQGTGNLTRGASFTVSTLGFEDIAFSYDMRHSNTAPGDEVVQYSTDGVNFFNLASFATDNLGATLLWFNGRGADLSAITAADNVAALTFRVVASFAGNTGAYASSNSLPTLSNYGPTGTWRFDMVTVSGTPITVVPEPGTLAMLLAGLATVGFLARRARA